MIILDTNVLPRDGSLSGPSLAVARAVADQANLKIALPWIVVEESVAQLHRDLYARWEKVKNAADQLGRLVPGYRVIETDLEGRAERWRADLERSFTVLQSPTGAADEALRREAQRLAPARTTRSGGSGGGSRDVLIWLTALDAHRHEPPGGTTYFVTGNSNDFGKDDLLSVLRQEVDQLNTAATFSYLESIPRLLAAVATPVGAGPSGDELLASEQVRRKLAQALQAVELVGDYDVWSPTSGSIRFAVTETSLREAQADSAYRINGRTFAAVRTIWNGSRSVTSVTTQPSRSYEFVQFYAARVLLLAEIGEDGAVTAVDVVSAGPFVAERSEVRVDDREGGD